MFFSSVDLTHAELGHRYDLCPWGSPLRRESRSTAARSEQEVTARAFCKGTGKG